MIPGKQASMKCFCKHLTLLQANTNYGEHADTPAHSYTLCQMCTIDVANCPAFPDQAWGGFAEHRGVGMPSSSTASVEAGGTLRISLAIGTPGVLLTDAELRVSARPGSACSIEDCVQAVRLLAETHSRIWCEYAGFITRQVSLCDSTKAWTAFSGQCLRHGRLDDSVAFINLGPLLGKGIVGSGTLCVECEVPGVWEDKVVDLVPLDTVHVDCSTELTMSKPVHIASRVGANAIDIQGPVLTQTLDLSVTGALWFDLPSEYPLPLVVRMWLSMADGRCVLLRARVGEGIIPAPHSGFLLSFHNTVQVADSEFSLVSATSSDESRRRAWFSERIAVNFGRIAPVKICVEFAEGITPPDSLPVFQLLYNILVMHQTGAGQQQQQGLLFSS
jgi:hypothetical protein